MHKTQKVLSLIILVCLAFIFLGACGGQNAEQAVEVPEAVMTLLRSYNPTIRVTSLERAPQPQNAALMGGNNIDEALCIYIEEINSVSQSVITGRTVVYRIGRQWVNSTDMNWERVGCS